MCIVKSVMSNSKRVIRSVPLVVIILYALKYNVWVSSVVLCHYAYYTHQLNICSSDNIIILYDFGKIDLILNHWLMANNNNTIYSIIYSVGRYTPRWQNVVLADTFFMYQSDDRRQFCNKILWLYAYHGFITSKK